MIELTAASRVYLAAGATDLRKSIDGLSLLVAEVLERDPLSSHLFCFCNRARDKVKILHWAGNGFWLYYKRLEQGRFRWPATAREAAAVELSVRELRWLLDGLEIGRVAAQAHRRLAYEAVS